MGEYRHTPEMGEISGFGGGYEEACQTMLEAGVNWLMERKAEGLSNSDLEARTNPSVFGILIAESDDAKALEEAMLAPVKDQGVTGAMHHAVMARLFFIAQNGWDEYVRQLTEKEKADGHG